MNQDYGPRAWRGQLLSPGLVSKFGWAGALDTQIKEDRLALQVILDSQFDLYSFQE